MSKVQIPPVLRAVAGGNKQVEASGATLAEVLANLSAQYPDLSGRLQPAANGMPQYLNIYLNDEDVRTMQWLATPVAEGDTVIILPAMAGGLA